MTDVVVLETPSLRLAAVPELGGRLLSLRALGREWLWRNPDLLDEHLAVLPAADAVPAGDGFAAWANWGGDKTWPAPQGWSGPDEWAGPPDPVLDAGAYEVLRRDATALTMRSAADPRSGLRITRTIEVDPDRPHVTVTAELENVSDRPVRWSAWSVTQLATEDLRGAPAPAGLYVGLDPAAAPDVTTLFAPDGSPRLERRAPDLGYVPVEDVVGKIGVRGCAGWLALVAPDGAALVQRFAVDHGAVYPDENSQVAVWMQYPVDELPGLDGLRCTARLVEAETMSPLTRLMPGESLVHRVDWTVGPGSELLRDR
jgi:hypothetical protein